MDTKKCEKCDDRLGRFYHHRLCETCRIIAVNDFCSVDGILTYLDTEIDILKEDYNNSQGDGSDPEYQYKVGAKLEYAQELFKFIKKSKGRGENG